MENYWSFFNNICDAAAFLSKGYDVRVSNEDRDKGVFLSPPYPKYSTCTETEVADVDTSPVVAMY